jgi:hypothetical protein
MSVQEIKAFPTLVLKVEGFLPPSLCKKIVDTYRNDPRLNIYPTVFTGNAITTYGTGIIKIHEEIEERLPVPGFDQGIRETLAIYCERAGIQKGLKIVSSIINIQGRDSTLGEHAHPGSILSAALYLKADDGCNKIYFKNPNPFLKLNAITHPGEYTSEFMWVQPRTGDLVIFPSWLFHSSQGEGNKTEERIAMAFNSNY